MSEVAGELGCAWHTVNDTVITYGEALLAADVDRFGSVTALGLDEVLMARLGTYRTQQFSTQLVDVRRGQLLDVLPGRSGAGPTPGAAASGRAGFLGFGAGGDGQGAAVEAPSGAPRRPDGAGGRPRPGVGSDPAVDSSVAEQPVEAAFLSVVDEGRRRLSRRLLPLLATGAVGGIDVGTGVLALLVVERQTHDELLGGLAFSFGFVALTLARSELFTEDFLVPVSTVIARQARLRMLLRLWVGTLAANLAAGWVFTWLVVRGFPEVRATAVASGAFYVHIGLGVRASALAVLGGAVITLMTWMQHSADHVAARVVAAVGAGFLLAGLRLDHAVVASLVVFAALQSGHPAFGYLQWAEAAGLAAVGNVVGGILLVTLLRLFQVPHRVHDERSHPALGVPIGDHRRVASTPVPTEGP